ncbi:hypothetical protein CRE_08937 [Caenorhabditis remanei]|uniref:Uncharacterized protein n=1 Tax=Caenorhabditis remanei TaxID=31234 RepID=E3LIC8_CAERE|nr:hypothetical protein CRE_08937 [Caenorhabditis remanei]
MNNISINGDPAYLNYKFDPYTIPTLAAIIPLFYVTPTIVVVGKILKVYFRNVFWKKDEAINPHVFTLIVIQLVMSFFYMSTDYTTIRIPATGIITNWCASVQPNHYIKTLFLLSGYFNYTAMLFPFVLSLLRLIPIYYPVRVDEICAKVVRISVPFIFLYPLLFCFPLIPALGDCRPLLGTYQFGAIYFHWRGSWFGWRLAETLILNSFFWLSGCMIANFLLYKNLKQLQHTRESIKIKKAERSLTLITISMFPAYITNLALLFVFIFWPTASAYLLALRPYGSDCDFVVVPWIFYMTHPIFKTKRLIPKDAVRVHVTNSTV